MKLAWEQLVFWNKKQQLIIKWLDSDYKKFSSIWFISKNFNDEKNKQLVVMSALPNTSIEIDRSYKGKEPDCWLPEIYLDEDEFEDLKNMFDIVYL